MAAAPVFPTAQEFVERQGGFDYIVVGGGTAGLVVAARCASSRLSGLILYSLIINVSYVDCQIID